MVGIVNCVFAKGAVVFLRAGQTKATRWVAFFFPAARLLRLLIATQYEIPFKLSISTFHVSVMAITPAIASHKVRHPSWSPSNFSAFMASDLKKIGCRDLRIEGEGLGAAKTTEPTAKRRPLSVVPDAQCQGEYQKVSADFTQSCRKSNGRSWGADRLRADKHGFSRWG